MDESVPDVFGDVFARGVFEPGDLVEIPMIQRFPNWTNRNVDVRVVDEPSRPLVDRSADADFDAKAVTVQAAALVSGGYLG